MQTIGQSEVQSFENDRPIFFFFKFLCLFVCVLTKIYDLTLIHALAPCGPIQRPSIYMYMPTEKWIALKKRLNCFFKKISF